MRQLKITNKITSRESLALDKYLSDIGRISMLTAEEEAKLARLIRQGDQEALEQLTRANLRFVVSVAKQYQKKPPGVLMKQKASNSSPMPFGGSASLFSRQLLNIRASFACPSIKLVPIIRSTKLSCPLYRSLKGNPPQRNSPKY